MKGTPRTQQPYIDKKIIKCRRIARNEINNKLKLETNTKTSAPTRS